MNKCYFCNLDQSTQQWGERCLSCMNKYKLDLVVSFPYLYPYDMDLQPQFSHVYINDLDYKLITIPGPLGNEEMISYVEQGKKYHFRWNWMEECTNFQVWNGSNIVFIKVFDGFPFTLDNVKSKLPTVLTFL